MQEIDTSTQILNNFDLILTPDELAGKIQAGNKKQEFVQIAQELFERLKDLWNPAIVYRWFPVTGSTAESKCCNLLVGDKPTSFSLGHSSTFMTDAEYALLACYTVGGAIELESQTASSNQQFLESYLLDIISLLVLEKTGNIITEMAEQQAQQRQWGVSPFLSPGSVHGWELEEQLKIAQLLPLEKIDINIRADAVLEPFKSLTCLIGIGKNYSATNVGTTCQVCSKNSTCQMRNT